MMKLIDGVLYEVEIDGVDPKDRPDFSDAYFSFAYNTATGKVLDDDELDALAQLHPDLLNELAHESFH